MTFAGQEQQINLQDAQLSLADRIARWTTGRNRLDTPIKRLSLHRWETRTEPTSYMLPPSICLIGQGRKRLLLGESTYTYDAHRLIVTTVDLPVVTQVIEASSEKPYLGLTLELDLRVIAQLILNQDMPAARPPQNRLGLAVSSVSAPLLDAFNRMLDLLADPDDIPGLAPLLTQEILYRLLRSEQGPLLRQIASVGNHGYQISRAIDWLKANLSTSVKIEELASKANLSPSAFHNHFRANTAMSPLQYQKRMRLNEARRLMFTEHIDASKAAYAVGYESPSQFSREYSRQFGAPPMRDIKSLSQESIG
ncbi:MAG: AraC family transcriptional regulator [Gammaproteobacteria bacterium]|nr:AraC family transcriptional regulator [Gammaproteobacteria bacterium]